MPDTHDGDPITTTAALQAEPLAPLAQHERASRSEVPLPPIFKPMFDWFAWYCKGYIGKHFQAIDVLSTDRPWPFEPGLPTVVYLNHPSWWDPLIGLVMAAQQLPDRQHYGMIDADALRSFRFFERIGFVGVNRGTPAGATQFLRVTRRILAEPNGTIWITPQGRYADARERPVTMQRGLGHLAASLQRARFVPLAIEYNLWDHRLPRVCLNWGEPVDVEARPGLSAEEWHTQLVSSLSAAQDELAAATIPRHAERFQTLLTGRRGMGNIYGWYRRWRYGADDERPVRGQIPPTSGTAP